jgi:hypothetical protein
MQAIICKYFGPTNVKGSRIKAQCAAGSITIDYPHELSGQEVYRKAAEALVSKLGWNDIAYGNLLGGQLPSGDYVFVFNNKASEE